MSVPQRERRSRDSEFSCAMRQKDAVVVLQLSGDVDLAALPPLRRALEAIGPGTHRVCLDLSAVPFMDSSGLRFLSELQNSCTRHQAELEVAGVRPQHQQLMAAAGYTLRVPCAV